MICWTPDGLAISPICGEHPKRDAKVYKLRDWDRREEFARWIRGGREVWMCDECAAAHKDAVI